MKKIFKNPLIILFGAGIGVCIGLFNAPVSSFLNIRNLAQIIYFPGQLYLFFLQMTVIPIIITAAASSLAKLIRNKNGARLTGKIISVFIIFMMLCAITGMAGGYFGQPGLELGSETRNHITNILSSENITGIPEAAPVPGFFAGAAFQHPGMTAFFTEMVPVNIFKALSLGGITAILFFSIAFGIAIGFLPDESYSLLINLCKAVLRAFQKMFGFASYLLPFGLICLLAGQIAAIDFQIFTAMSKFIIVFGIGALLILLICTIILWIRSGIKNPFKLISILLEPVLLALATRDSLAALPSAVNCLERDMKFDSASVNLTLPSGMILGRFGNIFYFALAVFFIGQFYYIPFEPIHYLITFAGVILAGIAAAGTPGIAVIPMLSIVLAPLRLPMGAVLIVFFVIDPIIDPFRTLLIVYVNMAAASLTAVRRKNNEPDDASLLDEDQIKNAGKYPSVHPEQLRVFIQEQADRAPLITRNKGILEGYEITLLNEIGRRMGKRIFFEDGIKLNTVQKNEARKKANIIAGAVIKTNSPPEGYFFSEPWGIFTARGNKAPVCFLLPEGITDSIIINNTIKTLKTENYFKTGI